MVASTDTPQIDWPAGLERPEPGPEIVYLNLNHWIGLSRVANGDGRYANALAVCSAASESGSAIFSAFQCCITWRSRRSATVASVQTSRR
jgi:hypothetical protein